MRNQTVVRTLLLDSGNFQLTLRSIGIWSCISHGHCKGSVMPEAERIGRQKRQHEQTDAGASFQLYRHRLYSLSIKFIFKLSPPDTLSARSISQWVTCLKHETLNHPMKDDIVIVPRPHMTTKVLQGLWNFLK
jgi:hypothetical protein